MPKGLLIVVSGFSGVGKGTLMKKLVSKYDNYALSISATTRKPRDGEEDGRDYFFKTREEFEALIREKKLIEYAEFCGNYYGTPLDYVKEMLENGKDVILEIEIQGASKVKSVLPQAVLVFVTPPDAKTLRQRLSGRGTEDADEVEARLKRAAIESAHMNKYDYIVVNDDIDRTVKRLHHLIRAQHLSADNNLALIEAIQIDMKNEYLKEN